MEIQEIKSKLTISEVIKYYGLKADKQNRLKCPFHEDKTPSMQLYYKTQTAFCFSSNCKIKGKAVDVIDFILHKENCTKHEAIKKAITLARTNDTVIITGKGSEPYLHIRGGKKIPWNERKAVEEALNAISR